MMSEKSAWLQKEHGKQKRVKICIGVGVVACATTVYLSSRPQAPARYDQAAVLVRSPSIA